MPHTLRLNASAAISDSVNHQILSVKSMCQLRAAEILWALIVRNIIRRIAIALAARLPIYAMWFVAGIILPS